MYKYYNAHPKGFWIDDSVTRAIAVTSRMEYTKVSQARTAYKSREISCGIDGFGDPRRYIENSLGAKKISFSRKGPWKMTAERFSRTYRIGRYILDMGWHFSACIDGVILDTWDCSDELITAAYLITPVNDEQKINLRLCYTTCDVGDGEVSVTFYDCNGRMTSKTMSESDALLYVDALERRGYPDMTDADKWL